MEKIIEDRVAFLSALKDSVSEVYNLSIIRNEILDSIYSNIEKDPNNHFVSKSQEDFDKISYARSVEDKFSSTKRVKTTFERYVRRQLSIDMDDLSDHNLNYLGKVLRRRLVPQEQLSKHIQLLSGIDIVFFYEDTIIESCMSGGNSYKTKLYSANPDIIKLVTYNNSARGLLWHHPSGDIILDRTYPNDSDQAEMIKTWAKNNNYIYRISNGAPDGDLIELSNNKVYEFTLRNPHNIYPYLDTFCFGNFIDTNMVVSNSLTNNHDKIFNSPNGGFESIKSCSCCSKTCRSSSYVIINNNIYCLPCKDQNFDVCSSCGDFIQKTLEKESIILIDGYKICQNCKYDKIKTCFKCNTPHLRYNLIYDYNLEEYVCYDCAR